MIRNFKKDKIIHFLELLWIVTKKEIKARYKYTIFGFFWLTLNPILQMIMIGFIFTFLLKEPTKNYYYFLFSNLLIWNFFSLSLSKTTPSVVNDRELIKKAYFPHAVIPLSHIFSNLFHLFIAQFIFLILLYFLKINLTFQVFYYFLAYTILISFITGLSLITSSLNVKYRDINFFVQAILIIWFYATPIVYTLSNIPYKYYWLWRLNPLTSVLQLFQNSLLDLPLPGPLMLFTNMVISFLTLILGIYIFQKESKYFDDFI